MNEKPLINYLNLDRLSQGWIKYEIHVLAIQLMGQGESFILLLSSYNGGTQT